MKPLFVYIDESGDFNFTSKGSKYYVVTAVITHTPTEGIVELSDLKYKVLTDNLAPRTAVKYKEIHICNGFHATYDLQVVRDEVFKIIGNLKSIRVHAIVAQKNKANPSIREEGKFYSMLAGYVLDYIQRSYRYSILCILFNGLAINKKKDAFIKSIKSEISKKNISQPYKIYFPKSSTDGFLDVGDYVCWAISRKWEKNDTRSYDLMKHQLGRPELEVFLHGDTEYYEYE